jgi:hypothetical protein
MSTIIVSYRKVSLLKHLLCSPICPSLLLLSIKWNSWQMKRMAKQPIPTPSGVSYLLQKGENENFSGYCKQRNFISFWFHSFCCSLATECLFDLVAFHLLSMNLISSRIPISLLNSPFMPCIVFVISFSYLLWPPWVHSNVYLYPFWVYLVPYL